MTFHEPNKNFVEVKRALPKDVIPGSNFGYYDIQMDVNRFLQQTSGLGQEVVVKISKRQVVVTIWASDKQVTNSLYVIFKSVVGRWKCVAHVCNSCIWFHLSIVYIFFIFNVCSSLSISIYQLFTSFSFLMLFWISLLWISYGVGVYIWILYDAYIFL